MNVCSPPPTRADAPEAKLHEGVAERRQREAEHGALLAGVAEARRREAEGHEAAVQQLRAVTAEHARAGPLRWPAPGPLPLPR